MAGRRRAFRESDLASAIKVATRFGAKTVRLDPLSGEIVIDLPEGGRVEVPSAPTVSRTRQTRIEQAETFDFAPLRSERRTGGSWRRNIFTARGNFKSSTPREWERYTALSEADRKKDAAKDRRWRDQLSSKPLSKRERDSLRQLLPHGVGQAVHRHKVKGSGCQAAERLEARGFIEFRYQSKFPDRIDSFVLTETGAAAARSLPLEG